MAELKTTRSTASVEKFLNDVQDQTKRKDCFTVLEIMKKARTEENWTGFSLVFRRGSKIWSYISCRDLVATKS